MGLSNSPVVATSYGQFHDVDIHWMAPPYYEWLREFVLLWKIPKQITLPQNKVLEDKVISCANVEINNLANV